MTTIDVTALFAEAPVDWWRFVPCETCAALRQAPCVTSPGHRVKTQPHAARRRLGLNLHHTLWLLANFPGDVLPPKDDEEPPLTRYQLRDLLLLGMPVPPSQAEIDAWPDSTARAVQDWAAAVHLRASDNDVEVPPLPAVLRLT